MKLDVAIVLVNYNGYRDTIACIESLQNIETKMHYEVIVVDNGSTNRDEEAISYIKEHAVYLDTGFNSGFSGGNNVGINYALEHGAEFVLLLNNDTVVTANFLDKLMEGVEQYSKLGALIGKIYYFDEPNVLWYAGGSVDYLKGKVSQHGMGKDDVGQYDASKEVGFVTGCMMLIPASVIRKIGVLDERFFLYAEDLEYSLRISKYGYKMYYNPNSVIYHKVGASSGREEVSDNTQYYMVRNVFKAFFMYESLSQRIMNFTYNTLRYTKYILQKRYKLSVVYEAYHDLMAGKMGKR